MPAMLPKEISSLQHPIVKNLVKLREDKRERLEKKQVFITGKKLIAEIAATTPLDALFLPKGMALPSNWRATAVYWVSETIFKKITGLMSPELIAATVPLPQEQSLEKMHWIVAFDGVSDPGNLGTLLRTALALGWEGAFLTPGCADPFNEKALRAAKGATFHLPLRSGSEEELLSLAKNKPTWVADLEGKPINNLSPSTSGLLILGNEAHGVSQNLKTHCQKITIPMQTTMESLNVASAGAILLYTLRPHGK